MSMRLAYFIAAAGVMLATCCGADKASAQAFGRSSGHSASTTPGGSGGSPPPGGGGGSPAGGSPPPPAPLISAANAFGPITGGCGASGGTGQNSANSGNHTGNTGLNVSGGGNCNTTVDQWLTQILKTVNIGNIGVNTNGGPSLVEINVHQ